VLAEPGLPGAVHRVPGRAQTVVSALPDSKLTPKDGQLAEAPNLSQIDRSYWLSGDPLPVTEGNLLRGKEVFLDRCVGCHG
jgi:mono/diheme cytochrome c family protein